MRNCEVTVLWPPSPRSFSEEVGPDWAEVVSTAIFVEWGLVGPDMYCLLNASFKPSGLCCQDFGVAHADVMGRTFMVYMSRHFRCYGARSSMFQKSCL